MVIEDLYNIIRFYNVKNNAKYKLPEETYKTLKSANKLENEIGNTTQIIINQAEIDNSNRFNSKQLESTCDTLRNYNKYTTKYYNIKHVQVY